MASASLVPGDLITVWRSGPPYGSALRAEVDVVGVEPWFTYKYLPRAADSIGITMELDEEGVRWLRGWSDENDNALAVAQALR